MKKRWIFSFMVLPLFLSVSLVTACSDKKVHQDLVGVTDDDTDLDKSIIDEEKQNNAKILKISNILIKGIAAKELVGGDTYEKAVEFIRQYVKNIAKEVKIEIDDVNQNTNKLIKNENKIKVRVFISNETNVVEAKLFDVHSELSVRIKELSSRWDGKVNGEKLTTFNTIEESSSPIFDTIKKYDSELKAKLLEDSGSKKLVEGDNSIIIIFELNDEQEQFKVNLEGVKISDLDYATNAIKKLSVRDKITTETKNTVILNFINSKLKELAKNDVKAMEIKEINGNDSKLYDSGVNELIISLVDSKKQVQDSKITFINVSNFEATHAIDQIKNSIIDNNIVFKLKINDNVDKLIKQICENQILIENYEYNPKWEIILADEDDVVETEEVTIDKDGNRSEDKKTISMRIRINGVMKAVDIEYDVYEDIK